MIKFVFVQSKSQSSSYMHMGKPTQDTLQSFGKIFKFFIKAHQKNVKPIFHMKGILNFMTYLL
jgi:hypothetical protein